MDVIFKYPFVLYESLIPLSLGLYYLNPFGLDWTWNFVFFGAANTRSSG